MPKLELQKQKPVIISVGGSMIVPNGGPDVEFLSRLKEFVLGIVEQDWRVILVSGGGKTARHYIDAADGVRGDEIDPEDLDWLGIHCTRLNGHLLRTIFREHAYPVVIKDPRQTPEEWDEEVLIAAGWKPGWSTDYVACRIAERLEVVNVVNFSNVDYVYEEDPRKNPDAKSLDAVDWKTYRGMVGDDWHPGKSAPFDPVASRFCEENGMRVAMIGSLERVKGLFENGEFEGTLMG